MLVTPESATSESDSDAAIRAGLQEYLRAEEDVIRRWLRAVLHDVFDPVLRSAADHAVRYAKRTIRAQRRARHKKPYGRRPRL